MDRFKVALHNLCVAVLLFNYACLAQECELSFHTEAESLMLLAGRRGTIVCDGTCFSGGGVVSVVWVDMLGRKVVEFGERLYAVTHKRGLISELVIQNATSDVSGTYTCSVSFNGRIIQTKSKSVIVFEKIPRKSLFIPRFPTGPRRGDQLIPEDINYRPVRSPKLSRGPHVVNDLDPINVDYDSPEDQDYAESELLEAIAWKKRLDKMGQQAPLTDAEKLVNIQDIKRINPGLTLIHELPLRIHQGVKFKEKNVALSERPSIISFTFLRRKRDEAAVVTNSTNDNSEILTENAVNSDTTNTSEPTSDDSSNSSSTTAPTSTGTTTSKTTTAVQKTTKTTEKPEGMSITNEIDQDGSSEKLEDSTICTTSPGQTNFGKYGILAFAVSLSLAFLLLYAILMIHFMPRILARRSARRKLDLEGPVYRKKHSDIGDIPPMPTIMNDTTLSEIDLGDSNAKKDLNSSLTSQSANDDDVKQEDTGPAVSTFLLRQASVNTKGNEPGQTKESSKENDLGQTKESLNNEQKTEDVSQTKTDLLPSDKQEEAAKATTPKGDSLLNNILTDIASSLSETKEAPETKGSNAEVKSKVQETDFDLPPFPDPVGSDVNKDIIDV